MLLLTGMPGQIILLVCAVCTVCHTRQQSKREHNSKVVLDISRGTRNEPDSVNFCPTKPSLTLDSQDIERKTMNCSIDTMGFCAKEGGYRCRCTMKNPNYVVSQRQCVNNVWLRQGCAFRFGSWSHSMGWIWNQIDDALLSLYLYNGYGITGAFNASNTKFVRCMLLNITSLTKDGSWGKTAFDSKDLVFFVYRKQYHISWNTENLASETRGKIQGRIMKFSIQCLPPEPILPNDILRDPTVSCLVFKVTGNFTAYPDQQKPTMDKSKDDKTIQIALGATFSILSLIAVVLGAICYRRKRSGSNFGPKFMSSFVARIT